MCVHRWLMLPLLLVMGCGSAETKVVTHPAAGRVFYDGKPAAGVQVFLMPTSAPMVPQIPSNPHATTGADGSFQLETFGNHDGAAEGGYQIVLSWPVGSQEDSELNEDRLLGWYTAAHSKLTVIIKQGSNTIPDIMIPIIRKPPEELEGIPGKN